MKFAKFYSVTKTFKCIILSFWIVLFWIVRSSNTIKKKNWEITSEVSNMNFKLKLIESIFLIESYQLTQFAVKNGIFNLQIFFWTLEKYID